MRRGLSILEVVAALGLALVMIPAVLPPLHAPLRRATELHETEAARLVLEGELARAGELAARGELAPGRAALTADRWPSLARLKGVTLERATSPAGEGLLAVAVTATWRSAGGAGAAPRTLRLETWVVAKGAR